METERAFPEYTIKNPQTGYDAPCPDYKIPTPPPKQRRFSTLKGVSPDEPIVTNAHGGKQAESAYAFHLLDPDAMLAMAEVMQQGAEKYERDNWRKIPAEEHFNHMVVHWYAWLKGDRSDDHLAHMLTRAMMCYATARAEEKHDGR